jgi:epoxyqueuosine reductase QueG
MNLKDELSGIAASAGAAFFGISDLSPAREAIAAQGGAQIASFPQAISLGISLLNAIVDRLPDREQPAVAMNYLHHGYDLINDRLDHLSSRVAGQIQEAGYRALPIPASQIVDEAALLGAFSHKIAAHLAGLGWVGKSCLLITPQVGPRVRWATVLTDAPLIPAARPMGPRCGDCRECVDICPVAAFTGRPFCASEPREARYDAFLCDAYFESMDPEVAACGLCLYICPFGRRHSE